jgi:hypothetical protein
MKTVIEHEGIIIAGPYENGYKAKHPGGIVNIGREIPMIDTEPLPFDPATQRLINEGYVVENNQYVRKWRIDQLSERELAEREWKHSEYQFRIRAPRQLGEQYPGLYAHFQLNRLPIEDYNAQIVDVYINTILQHHETLLQALQNVIEVHARPSILTPDETPAE